MKANPQKPLYDFSLACKKSGVVTTRFVLIVSVAEQTVSLFEKFSASWRLGGKMRLLHFAFRHRPDGRLELHAARIASHRGKNRRRRTGRNSFQIAENHRPHVAAGICGRQNHHAHPLAGRTRTRLQSRRERGFARALHLHPWHRRPDEHRQTRFLRVHSSGRRGLDSTL